MIFKPTTTSTTTATTTRIVPSTGKKIALCMGINEYPDPRNRLSGCVNDATDWSTLLGGTYGFNVKTLLDSQVTSRNFMEIFGNYLSESKAGDYIVATYSGHGSNVPDNNGDEEDGRDECICLYDRFFIDDEIRDLFKKINPEATLVFISDSCHSGTVTRAFLNAMGDGNERLIPRYMPPEDNIEAGEIKVSKVQNTIFYPEQDMKEILIAGCTPTEFSYDARINGRNNGAMTAYAITVLKQNPTITFADFYAKLRVYLPSGSYPQTPLLEGSLEHKKSIMFK